LPPSLHSFGGLVNSIHPRCHLFICLAATPIGVTPFLHSAGSITAQPSLHSFGRRIESRATIISAGWRISSLRRNHFSGPAKSIAGLQSFQWDGKSHRPVISGGRQIPSPHRNHFSRPVNTFVTPKSFQRAGESHRRAAIISAGW